jgi:hypothetical protein
MSHDDIHILLASLRPLFEVVEYMTEIRKENASNFGETTVMLQQQMALVSTMIRNHYHSLLEFKNMFINHKKKIDAIFIEQQAHLNQQEAYVKGLLKVALGDTDQVKHAIQDSETPLPSSIFKKTSRTELNEKETKFVEWMEKNYVFEDGTETDLKSFMEKAKEEGFKEKEFRSMRESLFTETSWAKQGRKLIGFALRK